jgi:hypothetical protein
MAVTKIIDLGVWGKSYISRVRINTEAFYSEAYLFAFAYSKQNNLQKVLGIIEAFSLFKWGQEIEVNETVSWNS